MAGFPISDVGYDSTIIISFFFGVEFISTFARMGKKGQLEIKDQEINEIALLFKAINHRLRIQFLIFLHKQKSISVQEIYHHFRLEQSVTSQHLAVLRRAGLVKTQRKGRQIFYSPDYENIQTLHLAAFELIVKPSKK